MKKYVILALLLAAYGISMAIMWSRYETRDQRIEFQSDFREKLVKLVPDLVISEMPHENATATGELSFVEAPDAETFLGLANRLYAREYPIIVATVEVKERGKVIRPDVLVRYIDIVDFTNVLSLENRLDAALLTHTDSYDWPGKADYWTATNLTYKGGDFHFDNKSKMWFWTYMGLGFVLLIWAFIALGITYPYALRRS